jgi:hypothetical protein
MNRVARFGHPGLIVILMLFYSCTNIKNPDEGNQNSIPQYYTQEDFQSVPKIDAHMHIQN